MNPNLRRRILRANGLFLMLFGGVSMVLDLCAYFAGFGPATGLIRDAPYTAVGFVEAHGLAFILGVRFFRADPTRAWHLTAAAVHVLLGASNLIFWQIFHAADVMLLGYVSTTGHGVFVVLELAAALSAKSRAPESAESRVAATS